MDVHLSSELEQVIQETLKSGRYDSVSDLVGAALRLLAHRDEVFALRAAETGKQVEEGWQTARSGELVDGDETFDRIDAELAAIVETGAYAIGLVASFFLLELPKDLPE